MKIDILDEKLVYDRFINVYSSTIIARDKVVEYDVVSSKHSMFCVVFCYNSTRNTVYTIKEYCQGPNEFLYSLVSGGFEPAKHATLEECCRAEMSEEARLCNGTLVNLQSDACYQKGISEVRLYLMQLKWSKNRFIPFICIDPEIDLDPRPQDAEEIIENHEVSLEQFHLLILEGLVLLPSVQTFIMATEYLKQKCLPLIHNE